MTEQEIGICSRIKLLRKEVRMTQTDFGNKIGIAQGYLTNIETGKRPATEKIVKIILLQSWNGKTVNETWLRAGEGEMFIQVPEEDETAALVYSLLGPEKNEFYTIILEIIRSYQELSPASQQVILDYAKNVLKNLQKKNEN